MSINWEKAKGTNANGRRGRALWKVGKCSPRYLDKRCCRSQMEDRIGREERGLLLEGAVVFCWESWDSGAVLLKVHEREASADGNGDGSSKI